MEVTLSPELEARLDSLSIEAGPDRTKFIEDVVLGYLDETQPLRAILDGRYDDLESGRVRPVPGDEVVARLKARSEAFRAAHKQDVPLFAFHPEAEVDIVQIWDYIASGSPDAADRVTDQPIRRIETASFMPHIGSRRADLTSRPLRFLHLHSWLIAYAPEKRPLWVVAILDGRRDPRVLAAILRERESKDSH